MDRVKYVVFTCGEAATPLCLASLRAELSESDIQIIGEEVRPLAEANNRMLDCDADWVVRVDADFIFYRGFSKRIRDAIDYVKSREKEEDSKIFAILFNLFDTFESKFIGNCKVYQMKHLREAGVRFRNELGCDVKFYDEIMAKGYRMWMAPFNEPIADHHLMGLSEIYFRFSVMTAKLGIRYVNPLQILLWIWRVAYNRSPKHAAALLGILQRYELKVEVGRKEQRAHPTVAILEQTTPDEIVSYALKTLQKNWWSALRAPAHRR